MHTIFALLLCLCVGVSLGQSKSDPKKQAAAREKPAAQDYRGTEELPLIIKGSITTKTDEKSPADREAEQHKRNIDEGIKRYTGLAALFTFFLVAITGVLARYTYGLWKSTHQLVLGAENSAQKELRAYIGVENIFMRGPRLGLIGAQYKFPYPADTPRDCILVRIRNFGRTPAYDTRCWIDWEDCAPFGSLNSTLLPDDFFDHGWLGQLKENAPGIVSQRMLHSEETHTSIREISDDDFMRINAARTGSSAFYVWGSIEYTDAFRHKWRTNFCHLWQPESREPHHWVIYREHNDEEYLGKEGPG